MKQALRSFLALLAARNREFYRDRATLGWALVFPAFVILGLYFAFSDDNKPVYKVGLLHAEQRDTVADPALARFLALKHVEWIAETDEAAATRQVARHSLDLLVDVAPPGRYWVNTDSRNGYFLEQMLAGGGQPALRRETLAGAEVRYVDWVVPGIIGMNMMFGCLWGVGYVLVRYRNAGILRRFKATPVSAFNFLAAQVVSRLLITLVITALIFFPSWWLLGFRVEGSLLALLVITLFGALALISLGLLSAARTSSLEVNGGVLNFLTWPMMLLSGVWFSLEGASPWVQTMAQWLPLTHFVDASRAVMIDGATLASQGGHLVVLAAMALAFMAVSAALFRWEG